MRRVVVAFVTAIGVAATAAAVVQAGGAARAASPQVTLVACHDVVQARGTGGTYWKCVSPFSLGIPHTASKVVFLVGNRGIPKGSFFTLNFIDTKAKQPLTSPVRFGPVRFDPGLWRLSFSGPFSTITLQITTTYNGKTLPGGSLFRFT